MKNNLYIYLFLILLGAVSLVIADSTDVADSVTDSASLESGAEDIPSTVYTMNLDGAIGTVAADRIIDAIDLVEKKHADLLLIKLDTPGGFNESMWDITKAIMNSTVPVAIYIYPEGARAASAGMYITYSAQIAAMAPSTNIGAAHVVSGAGEMDSVMTEKVMNDAVAQLQGMAEKHGRNAEWAEKAARESVSITASEAIKLNVVDFIASSVDDLLKQIDGHEVNMVFGKKIVHTANPEKIPIERSFIQSLLEIITSPTIAFILFSLGGLGLVIELYNPGAILPGVVGGICLILAFYSFRTLPINYAGLLLIIFAVILFILEVKVVSYGLLSIGGIISFIIGGLMLVDTNDPSLKISKTVIFSVAVVVAAFVIFAVYFAAKARMSRPTTGAEGLVGVTGTVRRKIDGSGMVFVAGEYWEARANEVIDEGEEIEVEAVEGMRLRVRKV